MQVLYENCRQEMVDQDIPLQVTFTPEVAAALIDLAQLAQLTGSTTIENLDSIADKMLARLLLLCSAQRGAVFLGLDERLQSELRATHHTFLRTLVLEGINQETASALLSTLPLDNASEKPDPELTCWLTYRLSLGEFVIDRGHFSDDFLLPQEIEELLSDDYSPFLVRLPLDALLVLGWTAGDDSKCASVVERGHHLLPYVTNAMGAVIVGILQAERIHELEVTRIR